MKKWCKVEVVQVNKVIYSGYVTKAYEIRNCQSPAYFMQLLASASSGEIPETQFATHDVAKRYEWAKWCMTLCSFELLVAFRILTL